MRMLLVSILRHRHVTADTIFGGVCVYLLIGAAWIHVYALVEFVHPGSFAVGGEPLAAVEIPGAQQARGFLYFSFVTLTTLGYGDITPVTDRAQAMAILEAIAGPVFLAVFIGRLVGLHMQAPSR